MTTQLKCAHNPTGASNSQGINRIQEKSGYGVMAVVHHQKMGQHQRYDDIGLLSLSGWVMSQLADLYFQRKVAEVSVDQGHAPYIIMLKMSWQDTATDGHIR
ncbi:MAG: hypothetical protein ACRDCL_03295 [Aeromonas veronii]